MNTWQCDYLRSQEIYFLNSWISHRVSEISATIGRMLSWSIGRLHKRRRKIMKYPTVHVRGRRDYNRQKEVPREKNTLRREIRALDVVIPPIPLRIPYSCRFRRRFSSPLTRYRNIVRFVRATITLFFRRLLTSDGFCPLSPPGLFPETCIPAKSS